MRSRRCSRRSLRSRPTSCGASATSSATGQPNECCALVEERAAVCLCREPRPRRAGHDRPRRIQRRRWPAAPRGRAACSQTRRAPSSPRLEPREGRGVALFHGSARDPVWEYVLSDEAATATLAADRGAARARRSQSRGPAGLIRDTGLDGGLARTERRSSSRGALAANPGSVGQPRDGDPRAAYLVLDLDARRATSAASPTTSSRHRRRCEDAGLPQMLADRLSLGQ